MEELEVKTSKVPIVATVFLAVLFVPMGLGMLYSGVSGGKPVFLVMAVVILALFAAVFYLVFRAHRRTVRRFSARGVMRNDGVEFPWSTLKGIHDQLVTRRGQVFIWRREVQFNDGSTAWLIPSKISNFAEVRDFTDKLDCEHTTRSA